MAVVINEFEVVPEPPRSDPPGTKKNSGEKGGAAAAPPTDHEIKQMLERRAERLARVSPH